MPLFRPGKPWCRLTLASPATQPAGAQTIVWNTIEGDGEFTYPGAIAGRWYCDIAGLYQFEFALGRDATASASPISGRLLLNGSSFVGSNAPSQATANDIHMSSTRMLAAGDSVGAQATLHATLTAGFAETRTSLAITRIGPVRWTG